MVASWTGIYQYTIDQVLEDMIERCKELRLRLAVPEEHARQEFTVRVRIDTPEELTAYRHGGILPYVLRRLAQ